MKTKITRVTIVDHDGKRTSLKPNKIVDNIEEYRLSMQSHFNAKMDFLTWKKLKQQIKIKDMRNGIDRLFDEMKLRVLVIQASGNDFTPKPEEKEDEFVKLSEYEKANERAEHYRLKLRGIENLVCLLQKDNERLLAENEGLQELLSNSATKEADEENSKI